MKYTAYNKLYYKGKPIGHKFKVDISKKGETMTSFKQRINRSNTVWNKWNRTKKNGKYSAKLISIKRLKK